MAVRLDWASIGRLVLAHHPRCHPFRHDVYRVGSVSLCLGCWTAYPVAAVLLVGLCWLAPGPWWAWLASGLVVGSTQFLAIAGWTATRRRKMLVKALLGVGLACTVYGIMAAPWSVWWQLAALAGGASVAGLAMVPRGLRMRATCETCLFRGDWERCTGMALVRQDAA